MDYLIGIVQHTPWWVFLVLAVLIVTGLQATRPRVVPVWRLLIVPLIFIAWGVLSVTQRSVGTPILALYWLVALAAGTALGWFSTRLDTVSFAADGVHVPGSPFPIVRNLLIFIVRYVLAVAAALAVNEATRAQVIACDVAASGLTAGYFIGWLARFARARSRASANSRVRT